MTDRERTPDSTDPATPTGGVWQRPLVRGAANGAFFAVMLCVIQVYGIFRPAQPLDHDTVAGNILSGVVFGFVMYIIEFWRQQRRRKAAAADRNSIAAEAARRAVEERLRRDEPKDPDAGR